MKTHAMTIERPYRTLGMRLYNRVGRLADRWRTPLTSDAILAAARHRTGLTDMGGDHAREALECLVTSYEQDAQLTPFGRLAIKLTLTHLAANRLRLQHALAERPAVRDEEIRRPVFVVGLPRTGTTLLFNLLCQDGGGRPLLMWEAMRPVSCRRDLADDRARRRLRARLFVWGYHRMVPAMRTIHPLDGTGPEECTALLFNTFVTPAFCLTGAVRGYQAWLRQRTAEDRLRAYAEYRSMLQALQYQGPPAHWVLKSPVHLFGLDALLRLFPDACVIQTHRDPAEMVPSTCSLFAAMSGLYSDAVDCRTIGPDVADALLTDLLEPAARARAEHPGRVFDVRYRDLVRDPVGTVRDAYAYFGRDLDPEMEPRMRDWLARNPANKHGVHRYDLAQFGLAREDVDRQFGPYVEQFLAAREPALV